MRRTITMVVTAIIFAGSPASAQKPTSAGPLVDAVTACRQVTDNAARLACFDRAAGVLDQATQAGNLMVVDREDVRKTRRGLFGFALPKLPFFSGDDSQEQQAEEIEAKIKGLRGLGHGKWQIELDTGAKWQTTEALIRPSTPRIGDAIKIKKAALGSYFITIRDGRAIRGMRIG